MNRKFNNPSMNAGYNIAGDQFLEDEEWRAAEDTLRARYDIYCANTSDNFPMTFNEWLEG